MRMIIDKRTYIDINKYAVISAIAYYLASVFLLRSIQVGVILSVSVGLMNLLSEKAYSKRLKLAGINWLVVFALTLVFLRNPMQKVFIPLQIYDIIISSLLSLIPLILLLAGKQGQSTGKSKIALPVKLRIAVQITVFTLYAYFSAATWIVGGKKELLFWGLVNILTVSILPFLVGRAMCGWICPNATLQDGLYKNLSYKRPIENLPEAIKAQTSNDAVILSGSIDKSAPYLPATLLLSWLPMFFLELIFDLTSYTWYLLAFAYGMFIISLLLPWRKFCTYFCFYSSYRCLASHNSLWRLKFNKKNCRNCKTCAATNACAMGIDIKGLEKEMPATCCLCFSCIDACPFEDVITFRIK